MERIILFKLNNTVHFKDGGYEQVVEGQPTISGGWYEFDPIVSVQYNQLKAKLFNLIESTTTNKVQQEALKGLVRGFCNTAYNNTNGDLCGWMQRMGFAVDEFIPTANPLESSLEQGLTPCQN